METHIKHQVRPRIETIEQLKARSPYPESYYTLPPEIDKLFATNPIVHNVLWRYVVQHENWEAVADDCIVALAKANKRLTDQLFAILNEQGYKIAFDTEAEVDDEPAYERYNDGDL